MTGEAELSEAQKRYNAAQHEMFQLAAYGHHMYAPLIDRRSGASLSIKEIEAGQRDYNNRIEAAREALEAAVLRLVAEHAETSWGDRGVVAAWLRSLADDPAELSLLAVRPDERKEILEVSTAWDAELRCPNCSARRVIVRLRRWPWRRSQWWRCHACFTTFQEETEKRVQA
ncbi:hypothetical protein [[Kitasatospora] papulosa]|uniref:hypothetical protein n=1 Tax=[Kitasatospora] papulosa TaxID=1464011 RepID=UPI0036A2EB33